VRLVPNSTRSIQPLNGRNRGRKWPDNADIGTARAEFPFIFTHLSWSDPITNNLSPHYRDQSAPTSSLELTDREIQQFILEW